VAKQTTQRWVIGGAVVVGILLLISEHNNDTSVTNSTSGAITGSAVAWPCTVTVTAEALYVRSDPDYNASVVDTLSRGAVVAADRTVRNGFRQLGSNRWARQEYLVPASGNDCG
jgi:hypothetical protein